MPAIPRVLMIAITASASIENFLRLIVSNGVATDRNVSLTAMPMVFVPKSKPISGERGGSAFANWLCRL